MSSEQVHGIVVEVKDREQFGIGDSLDSFEGELAKLIKSDDVLGREDGVFAYKLLPFCLLLEFISEKHVLKDG